MEKSTNVMLDIGLHTGPLQITGTHMQGKSDEDVEAFYQDFKLDQISNTLSGFSPNLKAIQFNSV